MRRRTLGSAIAILLCLTIVLGTPTGTRVLFTLLQCSWVSNSQLGGVIVNYLSRRSEGVRLAVQDIGVLGGTTGFASTEILHITPLRAEGVEMMMEDVNSTVNLNSSSVVSHRVALLKMLFETTHDSRWLMAIFDLAKVAKPWSDPFVGHIARQELVTILVSRRKDSGNQVDDLDRLVMVISEAKDGEPIAVPRETMINIIGE